MDVTPEVKVAWEWLGSIMDKYPGVLAELEFLSMPEDQLVNLHRISTEPYDAYFLTGKAGTGKSYLTKLIAKIHEAMGYTVIRTATTGVAAQQEDGCTLHSTFGLGGGDVVPKGAMEDPSLCKGFYRRTVQECASRALVYADGKPWLVIVGEVSMASSEQLLLLYQVVQTILSCKDNHPPAKFLLVGDLRQLSVVRAKNSHWPEHTHYCFEPAVFEMRKKPKEVLTYGSFFDTGPFSLQELPLKPWVFLKGALYTQKRQREDQQEFKRALTALSKGQDLTHPHAAVLKQRVFFPAGRGYTNQSGEYIEPEVDLAEATHLFQRNGDKHKAKSNPWHWQNTVGEYNEQVVARLKKEKRRSRSYQATITPAYWSKEQILQHVRPIPEQLTLFEGMRFLCRHNYGRGLANGTMCRVVALHQDGITLERAEDNLTIKVTEATLPLPRFRGKPVGEFKTVIIGQVGNAMTYWTCQGLTLHKKPYADQGEDCIVVHVENRPQPTQGLFYVACSRVETLEQLYILAPDLASVNKLIYCDPKVLAILDQAEAETRALTGKPSEEVPAITLEHASSDGDEHRYLFRTDDTACPYLLLCESKAGVNFYSGASPHALRPIEPTPTVQKEIERVLAA